MGKSSSYANSGDDGQTPPVNHTEPRRIRDTTLRYGPRRERGEHNIIFIAAAAAVTPPAPEFSPFSTRIKNSPWFFTRYIQIYHISLLKSRPNWPCIYKYYIYRNYPSNCTLYYVFISMCQIVRFWVRASLSRNYSNIDPYGDSELWFSVSVFHITPAIYKRTYFYFSIPIDQEMRR